MSKVEIGGKYEGPPLDRPCLRQMPRHWILEEARPPKRDPALWVKLVILAWLILGLAQLAKGLT